MKKTLGILVILILTFSIAVFTGGVKPCTADDPPDLADAYQQALGYLAGAQNADGSWGTLPERNTALAAEALASSGNADYQNNIDQASSWYSQTPAHNLDVLARKIWLGLVTGNPMVTDDEQNYLLYCFNPDGGMCLAPYYPSTLIDTALGIYAIPREDASSVKDRACYLISHQEQSGGFGLRAGSAPDLFASASAYKALTYTGFLFQTSDSSLVDAKLLSAIGKADAYLAQAQHADGGFGEQASTAYDTALVLDATYYAAETAIDRAAAVSFLLEQSRPDGSINGDMATTALFAGALRPNLRFSEPGISIDNPEPPEGAPLKVRFRVENRGMAASSPCTISYKTDWGTQDDLPIDSIPAEQTIEAEVTIPTLGRQGRHNITASINQTGQATDFLKLTAMADFFVTQGINLAISPQDIAASPQVPDCSELITLKANVRNTSTRDAQNVKVTFFDIDPLSSAARLGEVTLPFIDAKKSAQASLIINLAAGSHDIQVVVDEANTIPEISEDDNQASLEMVVAQAVSIPVPISPADGAALSIAGPTFTWHPSTGAQDITYLLELDGTPDFSSGGLLSYAGIAQQDDPVSFTLPNALPDGTWYWRVRATDGVKVTDALEVRTLTTDSNAPVITGPQAQPAWISPNADGSQDETAIGFNISEAASVDIFVLDGQDNVVRTLAQGADLAAGTYSYTWDGTDEAGGIVEGDLLVQVRATDAAGNERVSQGPVGVDMGAPSLADYAVSSEVFSPNGDGSLDMVEVSFEASEAGTACLELLDQSGRSQGKAIAAAPAHAGMNTLTWDGKVNGAPFRTEGTFELELSYRDLAGNPASTMQTGIAIDVSAPAMTLPKASISGDTERVVTVSVEVTGASLVRATFAGDEKEMTQQNGVYTAEFPCPANPGTYNIGVYAEDLAGNSASRSDVQLVTPATLYGSVITDTTKDDFEKAEENENIDTATCPGEIFSGLNQHQSPPDLPYILREAPAYEINGKIYIFGGQTYNDYGGYINGAHSQVIVYDPQANAYTFAQPMQEARFSPAAAKGTDGRIYLFGGSYIDYLGNEKTVTSAEVYNPSTNEWSYIPPPPQPITRARAAAAPDGRIYIFGGFADLLGTQTDEVLCYDPQNGTYEVVAHLPLSRCCHTVVAHDGLFYVMGGHRFVAGNTQDLQDNWSFNPDTGAWTELAGLPLPFVYYQALIGPPDNLYLFGSRGYYNADYDFWDRYGRMVFRYDFESDTWETLPMLKDSVLGRASAFTPDGVAWLFGGGWGASGFSGSAAEAEAYDPTYKAESVLVSQAFHTWLADFGRIALTAELPSGTSAFVSTRTSEDGSNWTEWSEEIPAPGGSITSPRGEYFQYRLRLLTSDSYHTARVFDVSFNYNLAPWEVNASSPSSETLTTPTPEFKWEASHDSNGDNITYNLEIDRRDDFSGPELKRYERIAPASGQVTSFELPSGEPLDDGAWYWRVKATDEKTPGPWSQTLSFNIDTTPPEVVSLNAAPDPFSPDGDGTDDLWTLTFKTSEEVHVRLAITDSAGGTIRTLEEPASSFPGAGPGRMIYTFTWDGLNDAGEAISDGEYAWSLTGEDLVGHTMGCQGSVEVETSINLEVLSTSPNPFSPRDPGPGDSVSITYRLGREARVEAAVYEENSSYFPIFVFPAQTKAAGEYAFTWDGTSNRMLENIFASPADLKVPDGNYVIRIKATASYGGWEEADASIMAASQPFTMDKLTVSPEIFTPNGDGAGDSCTLSFDLSEDAYLTLFVSNSQGVALANPAANQLYSAGRVEIAWDGAYSSSGYVPSGTYTFSLTAYTERGKQAAATATVEVLNPPPAQMPVPQVILPAAEPNHAGTPARLEAELSSGAAQASLVLDQGIIPLTSGQGGLWSCELPDTAGSQQATLRVIDEAGGISETVFVLELAGQAGEHHLVLTDAEDFKAGSSAGNLYTVPGWLSNWRPAGEEQAWQQLSQPPFWILFDGSQDTVTYNGKIYVFGDGTNVWTLDPASNTYEVVAQAPVPLSMPSAAVVGDRIYICGGGRDRTRTGNFLYAFDPATGTFTSLAPMPQKRYRHTLVASGGKLLVIGGMDTVAGYYTDILAYDLSTGAWEQEGALPEGATPSIGTSIQAFEAGGRILLFNCARNIYELFGMAPLPVWELTPGEDWKVIATVPNPIGSAAAQDPQGDIIIGGGLVNQFGLSGGAIASNVSSAFLFSTDDSSIRALPDLNVPRHYAVAACAGGRAYFFGGQAAADYARPVEYLGLPQGTEGLAPVSWESQAYDLGVDYELTRVGWSGANGPALTLSYSEDGVTWQDTAPMTTGSELTGRPLARYVKFKVDFPAGPCSSVGDIALTYEVPASPNPDLSITSVVFDPQAPEIGQEATVTVGVKNEGAPCSTTSVRLYADGEQVGGDYLLPYTILPTGMEETVCFNYSCLSAGPVGFTAIVDPDGRINEALKDNNTYSTTLEVQPSGIQASVATDKASYGPQEDVSVTCTVKNDSDRNRSLFLEFDIEDASGNYVDYLSYDYNDSLAPGEEWTSSSSWNTRLVYSGDYRVRVYVTEDWIEKATPTAPFAVEPQGGLALSATCDRISYSAGDTASLNARLISEASNFCFPGLTVRGEVLSPEGSVIYSSVKDCPSLYPGNLADVPFAYQVGSSPAGTYTFRATALQGSEDVASIETTFEVESTTASGAGISGMLSATPRRMEQGTPYTLDYTVENQGNCDLSGLPTWLLVVDPQTGEAADSRSLSLSLTQGASAQGSQSFTSDTLAGSEGGKNYLAVLIVKTGENSKTLGFTTLQVGQHVMDHFIISEITSPQEAGAPFTLSATAYDAQGNLAASCNEVCTLTDATGTVEPQTASFVSGVLNAQLTVTKATAADTVTLSTGDITVATNPFEVVAASADHLTAEPVASPQVAGTPFAVSATAYDVWGNLAAGFNGACTITDATGTVAPTSATFASGVLNAQITVTKATAADTVALSTGDITVTTNSFEVVAGASDHLTMEQVASPQVAGTPFAVNATAYDVWGNLAAGFNGAFTITDATGTVAPTSANFASGVLNASLTVTKATASDTVTITAGSLTATSNTFAVTAAVANHLTVSAIASPQTAGAPFAVSATVYDAYNNPATAFNGSCTITDATGTVIPTSATFASGVLNAQITVTKATTSDTVTITAGGHTATSNSFAVTAAVANHLTVSAIASSQTAGAPFGLAAYAWDAYNNPATFNAACTITDATGTLTPHTASFTGGTLSVQATVSQAIASDTITISASGLNVSSNAFEVKSPAPVVNIDLSLSIENQTAMPSVLVWTDGDQNEAMITEVLTASGYNYTIVRADHDAGWHGDGGDNNYGCGNDNGNGHGHQEGGVDNFAAEMRSGAYNVFMLLSPDHPLEDGLADELRELVNAGAGLLVSDPANLQHFKEHPSRQGVIDLFGIKQKGNLASGNYTANLTSSVLSPAATLAFTGKMDKLEIDDAQTLGTVTIRKGNKTETWPALTLKQYGRGKASLAAFDFAKVAQTDRNKAKTILTSALSALCGPYSLPDAGNPLPLRINLANHGAAVNVKVEIPLPARVTFLWGEGAVLNQGKVVFTLPLAAGETRALRMLMVPQQTGTYTVTASLYYQQAGTWTLLKQSSATASISKSAASLKTDTLAAISALQVASRDRHYRDQVYGRVAQLNSGEQNPGEVGEDIEDLTGAADDLQRISSADTTAARLLLDRLLIQLQIRWYTLSGGDNR